MSVPGELIWAVDVFPGANECGVVTPILCSSRCCRQAKGDGEATVSPLQLFSFGHTGFGIRQVEFKPS